MNPYLRSAAVMKTDRMISHSGRFSQQQLSSAADAPISHADVELMLSELSVLSGDVGGGDCHMSQIRPTVGSILSIN